jgi:hypothetical protein
MRVHGVAIDLHQQRRRTVSEVGDEVDHVYFPHNGMFSLLIMRDGKAIETATVGREGVIGAMAGLGYTSSWSPPLCKFQ